jgi:hypothetical protein
MSTNGQTDAQSNYIRPLAGIRTRLKVKAAYIISGGGGMTANVRGG